MCIMQVGDRATSVHLHSIFDEQEIYKVILACLGKSVPSGNFCKMVHSEPQCLSTITNLCRLAPEEGSIVFIIIDYEFSIIDHQNYIIIDRSTLVNDWSITNYDIICTFLVQFSYFFLQNTKEARQWAGTNGHHHLLSEK